MKKIINGILYDTDNCKTIASVDHYSCGSNNYSGETSLIVAPDGVFLLHTDSNGQDCWLTDELIMCEDPKEFIEGLSPSDAEIKRLFEHGLLAVPDSKDCP
jgi:hypothetical protein